MRPSREPLRARPPLAALALAACAPPRPLTVSATALLPAPRCEPARPPSCPHGLALEQRPEPSVAPEARAALRALFPRPAGSVELHLGLPARSGDTLALLAESWFSTTSSQVLFAAASSPPRAPLPLSSRDGVHRYAQLVALTGGRFLAAWQHTRSDGARELETALVSPQGALLRGAPVRLLGASPGPLVGTAAGAVYLSTTDYSGPRANDGLWAVWLDEHGESLGQQRLLAAPQEHLGTPAAAWDGEAVSVALGLGSELLFARVAGPSRLLLGPLVLDATEDPSGGFHAHGVVPTEGGAWLWSRLSFQTSVVSEEPAELRVYFVDREGRSTAPAVLSAEQLGLYPALDARPYERAALLRDSRGSGSQALLAHCRAGPAPAPAPPAPTPCDARLRGVTPGRFDALRGPFVATSVGDDVAVLARRDPRSIAGESGAEVLLQRLTPEGEVRWSVPLRLESDGLPALVSLGDALAVVSERRTDRGSALRVALFDAATGAQRAERVEAAASGCVGALPEGYALVLAEDLPLPPGTNLARRTLRGRSRVLRVRRERAELLATLPYGAYGCAWQSTPEGALLLFGNDEGWSETFPLRAQRFDARYAPLGEPRMLDESLHRRPQLGRVGGRNVALWTGPLERGLYALALDDEGAPRGPVRVLARSDGLRGYGLLAGAAEPRALFANERAVAERPLCALEEGAPTRLPRAHPATLRCGPRELRE